MTLQDRLVVAKGELCWDLSDMARYFGVSPSMVSAMLSGKRDVPKAREARAERLTVIAGIVAQFRDLMLNEGGE